MQKSFRTFVGLVAIVGLIGVFGGSALASHSWGNYHWARTVNPLTLKLGDNVTSAWDSYLGTSSTDWSLSSVLDTSVVASSKAPRTCRPTSGRVEVCDYKYGSNGWLGVAQIWVKGDHITQGTVKVNDTYFNTATYDTVAWRNLVMCQEVGHIFGLDHQDEDFYNTPLGTCMDYSADPTLNQHPNAHDYEQLETIYNSHFEAAKTAKRSRSRFGNFTVNFEGGQLTGLGEVVRSLANGRTSIFERALGGDEKLVTHIFWAATE